MSGQGNETVVNLVGEDASAWVVRLASGDLTEADALGFLGWLDEEPHGAPNERRRAFDQAQAVWFEADRLARSASVKSMSRPSPFRFKHQAWPAQAWIAAAACIVLIVAGIMRPRHPAEHPQLASYTTKAGEHRSIGLADGSRIDLDGATTLTLDVSRSSRRAVLARGEASFDVAHDPARLFTVDLGSAQVRVVGTAFDIVREPGGTTVQVARGEVSLRRGPSNVFLPAGRGARLDNSGSIHFETTPIADVGGWREGRRLYRNWPLTDVVSDLNRGYAHPLRLAGAAARRLRFTGVLVLQPREAMAHRLTALLPLSASQGTDGEIVLRSRGP